MFKGCGQPRLGKRSAPSSEINFESVKFDRAGSGGTGGASARPTTAAGTSLDRLVRDIKQKVCWLFLFFLPPLSYSSSSLDPPLVFFFFFFFFLSAPSYKLLRHLSIGPVNQTLKRVRRSRLLHVLEIWADKNSLCQMTLVASRHFNVPPSAPPFLDLHIVLKVVLVFFFGRARVRLCRRLKPAAVIGPNCQRLSALTRNSLR